MKAKITTEYDEASGTTYWVVICGVDKWLFDSREEAQTFIKDELEG